MYWLRPSPGNRNSALINTMIFLTFGIPVFLLFLNCIAFIIYSANLQAGSLFWTIIYSIVGVSLTLVSSVIFLIIVEARD